MINKMDEVLERALCTLQVNNAANRRSIYNRARQSLVEQLRKVTPPMSIREISNRQLMLEAGIQRIEAKELERLRAPAG